MTADCGMIDVQRLRGAPDAAQPDDGVKSSERRKRWQLIARRRSGDGSSDIHGLLPRRKRACSPANDRRFARPMAEGYGNRFGDVKDGASKNAAIGRVVMKVADNAGHVG
ncbi:MAG: hypothetical protein ABW184_01185 [Sphingobium sp.]